MVPIKMHFYQTKFSIRRIEKGRLFYYQHEKSFHLNTQGFLIRIGLSQIHQIKKNIFCIYSWMQ